MNKKVLIVGASKMAQDYIKVLKDLKVEFTIIGRGAENAKECEKITNHKVITGGIEKFLNNNQHTFSHAIVAVGIENLYKTSKLLLDENIKNILIEKPGALFNREFNELVNLSNKKKSNVYIAYNRRFLASVIKAREVIKKDSGVTSFNFEFTEWAHEIEPLKKAQEIKEKWFLSNSTHVVDLAFNLGGLPKEIVSYTSGSLNWHPSASVFCGAGVSDKSALFNYAANWESAGRWSIEVLTKNHKLVLRPMEKLQIQKRGSVALNFVEDIDYSLDEKYKPGLFLQTNNFISGDFSNLCSIQDQRSMITTYNKMANYK
jgi:predicted dehydrogenase